MAEEVKLSGKETVAYTIQDDREASLLKLPRAGKLILKDFSCMRDLQARIFRELNLPTDEHESVSIAYQAGGRRLILRAPSDLLGQRRVTIIVSDHASVSHPSEVIDVDRTRGVVEHINPMPSFSIHQAQAAGHHVRGGVTSRRKTRNRMRFHWRATISNHCQEPKNLTRSTNRLTIVRGHISIPAGKKR